MDPITDSWSKGYGMIIINWHKIIPETYIYGAFGVVVTMLVFLVRFGMKKLIEALKIEWKTVTDRLERIEMVQGAQAENHLNTIQANSTKACEILSDIQLSMAEQNGYLKAISEKK